MWIVKNLIRGTLLLEDLDQRIAGGDFFDLDKFGRERAEASESLRVAFEEGYLQGIVKDGSSAGDAGLGTPSGLPAASWGQNEIASQLAELRQMMAQQQQMAAMQAQIAMTSSGGGGGGGGIDGKALGADLKEAMAGMAKDLVGGLKEELSRIASQRQLVAAEKQEIVSAKDMSEAEVKARLAILDAKENELETNFEQLNKQFGQQAQGDGQADAMADLLGDI